MRLTVLFVCLLAAGALAASPASAQLRTGIADPTKLTHTNKRAFDRAKTTGASAVRLVLNWHDVADNGPAETGYFWGHFDEQVKKADARGLDVIASIQRTPKWIDPLGVQAAPAELGDFAAAAAARYDGSFTPSGATDPLPRIRYWQVWNEPNRNYFLRPQWLGDTLVSPERYRAMVNEVAASVRDVHEDNLVIAGGQAPLGNKQGPAPMRFMRQLLSEPVSFDIWSHHPYTSGGPTHKASGSGNVALGNLPTMRKVLRENEKAGRILTNLGKVQFWVTEFSWDTKGPDPQGVPMKLHARWTSEALYRMWRQGISLVTWFRIQDDPLNVSYYQSGFYTVGGKRKLSFRAFRFPFVAFRLPGRIQVWGRTPTSAPGKVVIQVKTGRRWRAVTSVNASPAGIFRKTFRTSYASGMVRARFPKAKEASVPFSLTRPKDRWVNPFGCGGIISC